MIVFADILGQLALDPAERLCLGLTQAIEVTGIINLVDNLAEVRKTEAGGIA